jgi:phosphoglycolate phosphatase
MNAPPTYRLLIFDFDGTLANSFPWFLGCINEAAARFRFRPIAPEEVDPLRSLGARQLMRHLRVSPWKLPLVARWMRRRMAAELGVVPLFGGVRALLEELDRRGVRLAVVSSNSAATVRRALGPHATLLGQVEGGASLFGKARRLRKVVRASGVRAEEVLCVGDEIRDAEAARRAGLAFGAVGWGYTHPDALRATRPALFFERVDDILTTLSP